ncbi:MAG TPA: hypothetical protein VER17_16900 [Tepidisphaeraceae bacterium]|nr:hypothetical protein [Tepidisphaeraceae bacterium]
MNKKWILVLVAFDDPEIDPQVIKEQIEGEDDEQLAALLRGGKLLDVLGDEEEEVVEQYRRQVEKECLR